MAEPHVPQEDPRLAIAARHALHDEELIAAFAVDGEATDEAARAKSLVERCAACRELHADLAAIGTTLRASGPAQLAGAARPAPRDFRLTRVDAARLRPGGFWQRIAAALFGGIAAFGRPIGGTLAAFGLVGLLVGTVGLGQIGGSPAAAPGDAFTSGTRAPVNGYPGGALGQAPAATEETRSGAELAPLASGARETPGPRTPATDHGATGPSAVVLLFAGSAVVLVLGLAFLLAGSRLRRRPSSGLHT